MFVGVPKVAAILPAPFETPLTASIWEMAARAGKIPYTKKSILADRRVNSVRVLPVDLIFLF
jgi:hypothetical protein